MIDDFILWMGWNISDILWLDLSLLGSVLLVLCSGPAVMYIINRNEQRTRERTMGNGPSDNLTAAEIARMHRQMAQQQMQNQYHPNGLGSMAGMAGGIIGNPAPLYDSTLQHRAQERLDVLYKRVEELREKMDTMEGFYTWMVHTYPDKLAEFKAIQDVMESIKARDES